MPMIAGRTMSLVNGVTFLKEMLAAGVSNNNEDPSVVIGSF